MEKTNSTVIPEEEKTEEKKGFVETLKEKKENGKRKFGQFIAENPGLVIPLISFGVMIVRGGFSLISNASHGNIDHCVVKDDVTGLNYLTEHPLKNSEILELSALKSNGATTGEALQEMDLLRNERKRK